jgi:hypothetical protein
MSLPKYRLGGQPCAIAADASLPPTRSAEQLALAWDLGETIKPNHLAEWVEGSAISAGIAEQALESIAGEQQVLAFLKPKAINAHRTYGGAMPMNKWARTARQRFAKPCAGGWLAYGHAPIEGGELVPVTYKPDQPRRNEAGDPIKYERPGGSRPVPYFAPLDQASAERIAARSGLVLPVELLLAWDPWSAWRWLLTQPAVELCLDEGEKKAAAACSAGWLTIGLAGIYGGCPRPRDANGQAWGSPALVAELAWLKAARPKGAPLTIAFDASEKPRGVLDVRSARRRLGRLLAADGHAVNIREMVQPEGARAFVKGTDDLLAHGGAEALAALPVVPFDLWLRESSEAALRARLVHAFKLDGRRHRLIDRHFDAADIPPAARARLVALIGGMGSNKTGAVADRIRSRSGKTFSVTHRRSLADDQGRRFDLVVLREGEVRGAMFDGFTMADNLAPDHLERMAAEQDGFVTVVDSFHPGGSCELRPEDCAGALLFIDEGDAFLRHVLMAQTAIARHRSEGLANLAACCRAAAQVVLAGAQLDEITLDAFERMCGDGTKAHVVESTLRPAAGREAVLLRYGEELLEEAHKLAKDRRPFMFHTGSKAAKSKWSPRCLARKVRQWWPSARILEMDSETIRDPDHPAAAAILNPQRLLDFDVVLASPVLETGFSIEDPAGHFAAVLGHTSGHTTPAAFVQSLGRLRSDAPRYLWCSASGARIGSGSTFPDEIERAKIEHAAALAEHLVDAGEQIGDPAAFLALWSKAAADQNWQAGHYRHAVDVLLGAEGYGVDRFHCSECAGEPEARRFYREELEEARDETVRDETEAVAATPLPDRKDLEDLEKRQRLTAEQRRQIERGRIERDLGLPNPSAEQVALVRDGGAEKALLHLLTVDSQVRTQWKRQAEKDLAPSQRQLAPDLTRALAPWGRAKALAGMAQVHELLGLVGTGRTVTMAAFESWHAKAIEQRHRWRELYGFDPGDGEEGGTTTRTFVAAILRVLGFELQRIKRRSVQASISGERKLYWHYEVIDALLPLSREQVQQHQARSLAATDPVSFPL